MLMCCVSAAVGPVPAPTAETEPETTSPQLLLQSQGSRGRTGTERRGCEWDLCEKCDRRGTGNVWVCLQMNQLLLLKVR